MAQLTHDACVVVGVSFADTLPYVYIVRVYKGERGSRLFGKLVWFLQSHRTRTAAKTPGKAFR
jgi:hypothetical protein